MEPWSYGESNAWAATLAIAETLINYLENYVMKQYGYDQKEAFAEEIKSLHQEARAVAEHIKAIMNDL